MVSIEVIILLFINVLVKIYVFIYLILYYLCAIFLFLVVHDLPLHNHNFVHFIHLVSIEFW